MNLTNIFRFRKPEGTDPVNVEDFNDNFDVIDTELNKRPEKTGNASDMVTTFSQAASRANLTPGEKISVSFGKIMKYFADMKTVAFTGSYADLSNKPSIPGGAAASQAVANNCTTTAAGSVLDARQGKVLMDKANQINSDLDDIAGVLDAIGTIITGSASGDKNISTSYATIASIGLPAGTYLIEGHVRTTTGSNDVIGLYLGPLSDGTTCMASNCSNGYYCTCQIARIVTVTSTTRYYLRARTLNEGNCIIDSAASVTGLSAIRIA